jgi:Holliday junction resolvasome RuvABC endonuclease subunit
MPTALKRSPLVSSTRVLGIDISLNHAAFVQLKDGELDGFTIVTDTKSIAATTDRAVLFSPKSVDSESKALERLDWWRQYLSGFLGVDYSPDYVAIEDYAFAAKQGAHQIGEVGGLMRLELWRSNVRWRKYTPTQLKAFTVHKGRAEKDEMVAAVRDRWDQDFSFLRPGETKLWTSAEDAADAYALAKLLDAELRLRKGTLKLEMLHAKEIEVFNAVSKKGGSNVLAQPFIQRDP